MRDEKVSTWFGNRINFEFGKPGSGGLGEGSLAHAQRTLRVGSSLGSISVLDRGHFSRNKHLTNHGLGGCMPIPQAVPA